MANSQNGNLSKSKTALTNGGVKHDGRGNKSKYENKSNIILNTLNIYGIIIKIVVDKEVVAI